MAIYFKREVGGKVCAPTLKINKSIIYSFFYVVTFIHSGIGWAIKYALNNYLDTTIAGCGTFFNLNTKYHQQPKMICTAD